VVEVAQVDRRLHDPLEPAPGRLEDRLQVREDLLGLLGDLVRDQVVRAGVKGDLPGDEDEAAGPDRLRVRCALKGRGRRLRANGLFVHRYSFRRWHALLRATPSALNIASRTCWASSPAIRRTCRVIPAPSAKRRRKSVTRSLSSPPTRASERSTFEA